MQGHAQPHLRHRCLDSIASREGLYGVRRSFSSYSRLRKAQFPPVLVFVLFGSQIKIHVILQSNDFRVFVLIIQNPLTGFENRGIFNVPQTMTGFLIRP